MLAVLASLPSCAAALQVLAQTFCISGLRARQLASRAGQACASSSFCQPGRSLQLAARQGAAGSGLGGSAGGQAACVTGGQVRDVLARGALAAGADDAEGGVAASGVGAAVGAGALAQPASMASSAEALRREQKEARGWCPSLYSRLCMCCCCFDGAIMLEDGSWIFFLEAAVAGGVLILIVWSTWPKDKNAIDRTAQSSAEHSRNSAAPESQDEPR